jgi:hypothetical protein
MLQSTHLLRLVQQRYLNSIYLIQFNISRLSTKENYTFKKHPRCVMLHGKIKSIYFILFTCLLVNDYFNYYYYCYYYYFYVSYINYPVFAFSFYFVSSVSSFLPFNSGLICNGIWAVKSVHELIKN